MHSVRARKKKRETTFYISVKVEEIKNELGSCMMNVAGNHRPLCQLTPKLQVQPCLKYSSADLI